MENENKDKIEAKEKKCLGWYLPFALILLVIAVVGSAGWGLYLKQSLGEHKSAVMAYSANPDGTNITLPDGQTPADGYGAESEIWVWPTNDDSIDPVNIQWALDNVAVSGTVKLKMYAKGTTTPTPFLFADVAAASGIKGVEVERSVTIKGEFTSREDDGRGVKVGTTVMKGQRTFRVGRSLMQPSVTIKDIRFDGAGPDSLYWASTSGYNEISGCSILNMKLGCSLSGSPCGAWWFIIHGHNTTPVGVHDITGTLVIKDNFLGKAAPSAGPLNNLLHISNIDLDLTVTNNRIEDAVWAGILVWGNVGTTAITDNVVNKTGSFVYPGGAIAVGTYPATFFEDFSYQGSTVIARNTVTLSSWNSFGISLSTYPASQYIGTTVPSGLTYEVYDNKVTVSPDAVTGKPHQMAALACSGACSNSSWHGNTVSGAGYDGIRVDQAMHPLQFPSPEGPSGNSFTENDLSGFTANGAQIAIGVNANDNTFSQITTGVGDTIVSCSGNDNTIKQTKVDLGGLSGSLNYGLYLGGTAKGNMFSQVDMSQATLNPGETNAHIYCEADTSGNTFSQVAPKTKTVIDLGSGNVFVK